MQLHEAQCLDSAYACQVYTRTPLLITRGAGMYVWDDQDRQYLDFCSGGRAVNALGHCHPVVVAAIQEQAATLLHTSNDFYTVPQARLMELLASHCACRRVFLCNSGAEANEAALKLARKYGTRKAAERWEVITAQQSFHGRTFGAMTATGQPKYQQGFGPLVPGFRYVPFNDLPAMAEAITTHTCAVMLEPVQGESGGYPATPEYLQGVRRLCDDAGALLIMDEVQTGLGRTGRLFAYEHADIKPDIVTIAKALGGGVPIGAMLATEEVAQAFAPGDHASTFGGSALVAAAAYVAVSTIIDECLPAHAAEIGHYLAARCADLQTAHPVVTGYRVVGCMAAIDLAAPIAPDVKSYALEHGVIIQTVGTQMIRLLPALICERVHVDRLIEVLDAGIHAARQRPAAQPSSAGIDPQ